MLLSGLYYKQREILFVPSRSHKADKGFYIVDENIKIWIEVRNSNRKRALLYFAGNSENYWQDIDTLSQEFNNFAIYFMHYRGYGASGGEPTKDSILHDAILLYDKICTRYKSITSIGRSLGSTIASYIANERDINKLVLVTPYSSIADIASYRYPFVPVKLLLKDNFDTLLYVPGIKSKTLVVLAENDKVIPHKYSYKLIKAFKKTKPEVYTVDDTTHGDIMDNPETVKIIKRFLNTP